MHEGPQFPGESVHQAMGENTAASLTAHMIRRAHLPVGPGHGFEHEPLDDAERASQHVAQSAASIRGTLRPGSNPIPAGGLDDELEAFHGPYDEEEARAQDPHEHLSPVARRLRSGGSPSDPARRTPTTPRSRRGPGGPSRP